MRALDLTHLLEQAQRRVSRELDKTLAEIGASGEQWRVLERLADEVGQPIGELAALVNMNPPTMTKLIDRMVAGGLVQRIADAQDNRRVLVFITDTGLQLAEKLSARADAFHENLFEKLNKGETAKLSRWLRHLADAQQR
ncbi:MAG: MarR family transcriptional regulator [Burkholderiaceae bacterium]